MYLYNYENGCIFKHSLNWSFHLPSSWWLLSDVHPVPGFTLERNWFFVSALHRSINFLVIVYCVRSENSFFKNNLSPSKRIIKEDYWWVSVPVEILTMDSCVLQHVPTSYINCSQKTLWIVKYKLNENIFPERFLWWFPS